VTVLIPAFNAEATIGRAIGSARRQNYRPIEIVVVNDASTDNTEAVVRAAYGDDDVKLFSLPRNLGECGAMNSGLQEAKGEFVAFLDADDEWLDEKLAKQVRMLSENPRMSFVSCGCIFVSDTGQPPPYEWGLELSKLNLDGIWRKFLGESYVAKPAVVARRSMLDKVGPFDTALTVAGDQDMWIRLALVGDVGIVPEILVRAHDTPNSLTKKYAMREAEFILPMVKRHIERERGQLTAAEIRSILGERYTKIGRNLYVRGQLLQGATFLLQAIFRRYEPLQNAWYILTASPISRSLKRVLFRDAPKSS